MKRIALASAIISIVSHSISADWDPEDTTFDPKIASVVVENSTRIGDPAPFWQEGYDIQSYTHVQAYPDTGQGALVGVSLIVPMIPGDTKPIGGASIYCSIEEAKKLAETLREGANRETAPEKDEELAVIKKEKNPHAWKVVLNTDSKIELHQDTGETVNIFRFAPNPAKKLASAIEYYLKEVE
ncbi:MAG: hypothetical protein CMO55_09755 [Verrucomicrobiales bacterium]|nr:hypothetical protein [Verrucomicrobiales bacterium]